MTTFSTNISTKNNLFNNQDSQLQNRVSSLYKLKSKFEKKYFKLSGCRKYDKARDFNIELSATLYRVNQLLNTRELSAVTSVSYNQIDSKINSLEKQLSQLIS